MTSGFAEHHGNAKFMKFATKTMTMSLFQDHDHEECIEDILHAAKRICEEKGVRLTPLRAKVLEAIAGRPHQAVGAYDLQECLGDGSSKPAPITIYRVLDFLAEQGLVHRLASMNAFIACAHTSEKHRPEFLICRECGAIGELSSASTDAALEADAEKHGFQMESTVVEILGLCPKCV